MGSPTQEGKQTQKHGKARMFLHLHLRSSGLPARPCRRCAEGGCLRWLVPAQRLCALEETTGGLAGYAGDMGIWGEKMGGMGRGSLNQTTAKIMKHIKKRVTPGSQTLAHMEWNCFCSCVLEEDVPLALSLLLLQKIKHH